MDSTLVKDVFSKYKLVIWCKMQVNHQRGHASQASMLIFSSFSFSFPCCLGAQLRSSIGASTSVAAQFPLLDQTVLHFGSNYNNSSATSFLTDFSGNEYIARLDSLRRSHIMPLTPIQFTRHHIKISFLVLHPREPHRAKSP